MALTDLGNVSWRRCAPETWNLTAEGLDELTVPFDGRETYRTAFQAGLVQWTPSSIDGNMFLAGWSNTDHKQYSRIDLRYLGLKGHRSYSIRETLADNIQNAVWSNPPDTDEVTVDLTYVSNVVTATQYGPVRATSALGSTTPADIAEDQVVWWEITGTFGGTPDTSSVLAKFASRLATLVQSEEIVPGRLYRNSTQRFKLLFPIDP